MWVRQSQKWAEDRTARAGTFNTIIENLKEVLRIRIQSRRRSLKSCQSSRQSIDEAVDKLTQDLQVTNKQINIFFLTLTDCV